MKQYNQAILTMYPRGNYIYGFETAFGDWDFVEKLIHKDRKRKSKKARRSLDQAIIREYLYE